MSYGDENGGAYKNCMTDVCNCFLDPVRFQLYLKQRTLHWSVVRYEASMDLYQCHYSVIRTELELIQLELLVLTRDCISELWLLPV